MDNIDKMLFTLGLMAQNAMARIEKEAIKAIKEKILSSYDEDGLSHEQRLLSCKIGKQVFTEIEKELEQEAAE